MQKGHGTGHSNLAEWFQVTTEFAAHPEIKWNEQSALIFTFIMSCLTNNKRNARKESISFWVGLGPSENHKEKKII